MTEVVNAFALIGAISTPFWVCFCVWDFNQTRVERGIRIAHGIDGDVQIRNHHGRYYVIEGDAIRWLSPPKVTP